MVVCKCVEKFRNKQGKICGYRLQDSNGQIREVNSENLKKAILNRQVQVTNLTLTSNNRLVDSSNKSLNNIGIPYENLLDSLGIVYEIVDEYEDGTLVAVSPHFGDFIDIIISNGGTEFHICDEGTTGCSKGSVKTLDNKLESLKEACKQVPKIINIYDKTRKVTNIIVKDGKVIN